MKNTQIDTLENLVDSMSIIGVLDALEDICYMKAGHLRENWQDETSAKHWEKRARQIAKAKTIRETI